MGEGATLPEPSWCSMMESEGGSQVADQCGVSRGAGWRAQRSGQAQRLFLQIVQKEEECEEVAEGVLSRALVPLSPSGGLLELSDAQEHMRALEGPAVRSPA